MITYPILQPGATIGVTAPSSGIQSNFHHLMKQSFSRMERMGYNIDCGDMPPQITFVNGAWGEIEVSEGKGRVTLCFKS